MYKGLNDIYTVTSLGLFRITDEGESKDHVLDFRENDPINTYPSTETSITNQGTCYATIGGDGPDNGIYQCVIGETRVNISLVDWYNPVKSILVLLLFPASLRIWITSNWNQSIAFSSQAGIILSQKRKISLFSTSLNFP